MKILTNTRFSPDRIVAARHFWQHLDYVDLLGFWRHYTTGRGAGHYAGVGPGTGFLDYLVISAETSAMEREMDL